MAGIATGLRRLQGTVTVTCEYALLSIVSELLLYFSASGRKNVKVEC